MRIKPMKSGVEWLGSIVRCTVWHQLFRARPSRRRYFNAAYRRSVGRLEVGEAHEWACRSLRTSESCSVASRS
jgi:hypothetical protein